MAVVKRYKDRLQQTRRRPTKQQILAMGADQGFERHRKPTRRDVFLETMNWVVPCEALCTVVELYYPKNGNGRPPILVERMLRIHFLQH
jgi:IS5 family transposase